MDNFEDMQNADSLATEVMAQVEEEQLEEFESGPLVTSLVRKVRERFEEAERSRDSDEQRWLQAYQNYRGNYSKNMRFTETE